MLNKGFLYIRQNKEKILRISKEGGWILSGQIVNIFCTLLLVRLLTEFLGPEEFGKLALGLTIAGLMNQAVLGGLNNGITRYYSIYNEKDKLDTYFRSSIRLIEYCTYLILVFFLLILISLLLFDKAYYLNYVIVILIFSLISGYSSTLSGILNTSRQRSIESILSGLNSLLKIFFAILAIYFLGKNSINIVLSYATAQFVVLIFQIKYIKRYWNLSTDKIMRTPLDKDLINNIFIFSWPFSAWGIFTWLQQSSDRWALETFASTPEVGQYVTVFQIGYTPVSLITNFMVSLIGPILFQKSGHALDHSRNESVHNFVWNLTWLSLFVTLVAVICGYLFHVEIFYFLVATEFREISFYLPLVILAGGLFAAGQMLSMKLISELKPRKMLELKIITAITGVVSNILGAYFFGMSGVIGGLVFFSLVYFIWISIITRKSAEPC